MHSHIIRERLRRRLGSDMLDERVYAEVIRHRWYDAQPELSWLREKAYAYLKPKRIAHVAGCENEAVMLAVYWGEDPEKAAEAAILHDIGKKYNFEEQLQICEKYGIINDHDELANPKILHAKTGAAIARDVFGTDEEVTEAIGIIGEITGEMKELFTTRFREIDESFRATFLELFGGGKAALQLEDEENVLECGIEIKVQPPGKAVSNISLLSGGEKAFVAIALYFAILKVRPTPFCVMDEIEAALDEANVSRFADYLRRMADRTQFLVITHRRGTMEEADMLYGVTMQEKGVSAVLELDLAEAQKTIEE